MAASEVISAKPVGAHEGYFYEITATGDQLEGGATDPTYATGHLIPCLQSLAWGREIVESELEGNDDVCDVWIRTKQGTFELGMGGLDMIAYDRLLGVTSADFGAGNNSYIDIGLDDIPEYFGLICRAVNSSGGDTHIQIFRAKAKDGPGGSFEQGSHYAESWSGVAHQSYYGDRVLIRVINHETAAAIPATWPGNTPYQS